jgi:hypothetical protein
MLRFLLTRPITRPIQLTIHTERRVNEVVEDAAVKALEALEMEHKDGKHFRQREGEIPRSNKR